MNEKEQKNILSLKDVSVQFNVRGKTLTAVRNVSLDIHAHETLAIVGESGSGKSVLTKTFAGLLDSNGRVSSGSIILEDDDFSATELLLEGEEKKRCLRFKDFLDSCYENITEENEQRNHGSSCSSLQESWTFLMGQRCSRGSSQCSCS